MRGDYFPPRPAPAEIGEGGVTIMEIFLIGFILGVICCWLWFQHFRGTQEFRQLIRRELASKRPAASDAELQKKVAELESSLRELKQKAFAGREGLSAPPARITPEERPLPRSEPGARNKREKREVVLAMWKEGTPLEDIAAQAGVGKGEVELVVKMNQKLRGLM